MQYPSLYRLLVRGRFGLSEIQVDWHSNEPDLPASEKRKVDSFWARLFAQRSDTRLYDGLLCRLMEYRVDGGKLFLRLGRTRYRYLLYSNAHAQAFVASGRPGLLSRALGVSAVLRTADQQLLLLRRSKHVAEAAGMLDVAGGHIEPSGGSPVDSAYLFQAIEDEVIEELNVKRRQLHAWRCLGLIETTSTIKPELIFAAEVAETSSSLSEVAEDARDRFEFERIQFVPESEIKEFVDRNRLEISPSAVGSLELFFAEGTKTKTS